MTAMPNDLVQRIASERDAISTLDSSLDSERTPYLKEQIRFASHMLDDALSALRLASDARTNNAVLYLTGAEMFLEMATQIRETVQGNVEAYGGSEIIREVGT